MHYISKIILVSLFTVLAGCDISKLLEDENLIKKQNEAKAIGAACKQVNKSLEDCYYLNPNINKSSIVIGWKEMDTYMRENKIEPMTNSVKKDTVTEKLKELNKLQP